MNRNTRVLASLVAVGAIGTAVTLLTRRHEPAVSKPAPPSPPPGPQLAAESVPITRGDTLEKLLGRANVDTAARVEMISAVRGVFDVRKFRVGSALTLMRLPGGPVEGMDYIIDPDHELHLSRSPEGVYGAAVIEIPGRIQVVPVCGVMQSSLFESIERAGERAELAIQVADIFAWDLDFYTDPQPGDEFCVLLEKKEYANGQPPTYRRILAARYVNAGTVFQGFLFPDADGRAQYYSGDGRSLQAAFLRSPLKFEARISSHFSRRRLHPVLGIYRAHPGTDYAVPTGASVQAIASGRVVSAGRSGASGNMVVLRHANGYESLYLHLSRIFVRPGQTVAQGQRIALSGATGLVTGPHLDFRLRRNGAYVNFERFRPPRATALAGKQLAEFAAERDKYAARMNASPAIQTADASPADAVSAN